MCNYNLPDNSVIGRKCKQFRKSQGITQLVVSRETNYSIENISKFETGKNDNMRILLWYMSIGLTYEDLIV